MGQKPGQTSLHHTAGAQSTTTTAQQRLNQLSTVWSGFLHTLGGLPLPSGPPNGASGARTP
eukprot:4321587-Alexandrium_andersonii.AAC.1